jgi:hypothetical protein
MWWIFPLMFVICMVMMFFMMRAFFGGRFFCGMRPGDRGRGEADARRREAGDDPGRG